MKGFDYRKLRLVMKGLVEYVADQLELNGWDGDSWPGDEKVRAEADAFLENISDDWPRAEHERIINSKGVFRRVVHVAPELAEAFRLDQVELERYVKEAVAHIIHRRKLSEEILADGVLESLSKITKRGNS